MTARKQDSPRRYLVDGAGRRVIVGLTIEETIEFETLDNPARHVRSGHVLWDGREVGQDGRPDERWRELYAKHEQAWSEWIAERRDRPDSGSQRLT